MNPSRPLTHDEKKAAEAAYRGRPFDASWSQSARAVYDGMLTARGYAVDACDTIEASQDLSREVESHETVVAETVNREVLSEQIGESRMPARHVTSRQDAIDAGLLVDVTKKAQRIGFNVAVGITKSLWNRSITKSVDLDSHEWDLRVRDMLLAVRLRLASLQTLMPWIEVPVLFPSAHGEESPQVFPIYALFHKDPVAEDCLTLLHPNELSSIRPSSYSGTEEEPSSTDTV